MNHVAVPVDASANSAAMPEFPWPFPKPLEQANVPMELLKREDGSMLKDLDSQIQKALTGAGYGSNRYFRIRTGGFAIATRMERYESNGRSSYEPDRWAVSDSTTSSFSLRGFLTALFTGKTGQYRLFVIVVTDVPFGTDSEKKITSEEAEHLMAVGWNALPKSIANTHWSEDVKVELLVYEFEKREGVLPEVRKPRASGQDHLADSKILENLKKPYDQH
jgi:hypothetical protein